LAESYFANGMNPEAIEAGERALKLAKGNRAYYKEQLFDLFQSFNWF